MSTNDNPLGQTGAPDETQGSETPRSQAEQAGDQVLSALHQVWLAGLGAVAVAGEQTAKLLDVLVEKGKSVEPSVIERGKQMGEEISDAAEAAGTRIRDAASKIGKRAEAAEAMLDERVRAALERMGYATKDDVQSLSSKLDGLTARLEELLAKRGRKPAHEGDVM